MTNDQTSAPSIRYRWTVLVMLTLVYTFNFIDRQILVILQEPIKADLGLSDAQLGLLTGFSFALVYVTAGIPIAWLADRSNRRNIVAASLAFWSFMTAISGLVQNFGQLLAARLGVSVGEAGGSPPSHSMISDYFPPGSRGTALSFYSMGIYIGVLFGFGFLEALEIDTIDFGRLLELAEPIAFNLLDDLISTDADGTEVWLERGGTPLEGEVAAEVYRWRNPGEVDANRNERQADLWEGWLASIALADDLVAATLPFDSGLSPYLRALAIGESDIQLLPAVPSDAGSEPTYVLDENATAWLAETADRMVPLPIPAPGVDVATVRLLDGVGDRSIADEARAVVARLSELIVVGNAAEFGLPTTTVSYHDEADAPLAEALAAQLNAEVASDLRLDEPVDLTVTIGADWEIP